MTLRDQLSKDRLCLNKPSPISPKKSGTSDDSKSHKLTSLEEAKAQSRCKRQTVGHVSNT